VKRGSPKNTLVRFYWFTYLIVIISPFMGAGMSWIIREPLFVIFLLFFFFRNPLRKFSFGSKGLFMISLYASMAVTFSVVFGGFSLQLLASMRFVFLYPILILVGVNSKNLFKIKDVFIFPWLLGIIASCLGVLEILNPQLLSAFRTSFLGETINVSNFRSGLGYGLTSIFGSRVVFGFVLVYTMILNRVFIPKRFFVILVNMYLISLVAMTFSRTAIITSIILLLLDVVSLLRFRIRLGTLVSTLSIIAVLLLILPRLFIVQKALDDLLRSLRAVDVSLSGRTDLWASNLQQKLSIWPNFKAFGSYSYFDIYLGPADNSLLKLIINYGWPFIVPMVLMAEEIIHHWRRYPEVIQYSIIMFILYSVTVDVFHILQVMFPFWLSLGLHVTSSSFRHSPNAVCTPTNLTSQNC